MVFHEFLWFSSIFFGFPCPLVTVETLALLRMDDFCQGSTMMCLAVAFAFLQVKSNATEVVMCSCPPDDTLMHKPGAISCFRSFSFGIFRFLMFSNVFRHFLLFSTVFIFFSFSFSFMLMADFLSNKSIVTAISCRWSKLR